MKHFRKISRGLALVLVFVAVLSVLITCAPAAKEEVKADQKEDLITEITKRGVMRVGLAIFVPWSFKDKDGVLRGFEVDVATQLAEDLGIDIEIIPTEWSGLIPALLTGKFDFIIAGMAYTPERALSVNFTVPYDYSGESICASTKLAAGWDSLEDFNREDVVISVRLGTTSVDAATKFLPKAQLRHFDSEPNVYQEVINGKAHAVVAAAPEPELWTAKFPDDLFLPLKGKTFTSEPICFAVRKGDPDTLAYLNGWITQKDWSGYLDEKHRYWFFGTEWQQYLEE